MNRIFGKHLYWDWNHFVVGIICERWGQTTNVYIHPLPFVCIAFQLGNKNEDLL